MQKNRLYGLLISAGLSGRMGEFKPLLEYDNKSFVQNITEKLCSICDRAIIVTGFNSEQIENDLSKNLSKANLQKVKFVLNENYKAGMFTSLKTGLLHCTDSDWVLYHFVDQPTLPLEFYNDFVNQIDQNYDWIQPAMDKRKGHPVLFGRKVIEKILEAPDNLNLREVTRNGINKKFRQCNFYEIFDDIDNIEDYKNLAKPDLE